MKTSHKWIALFLTAILVLLPFQTCLAAAEEATPLSRFASMPSVSGSEQGCLFFYTTADLNVYNYAEIQITGNSLLIRRRAYRTHSNPDEIRIQANGIDLLNYSLAWTTDLVPGLYSGYDYTLDTSSWGNGSYTLVIGSADVDLYAYTLTSVRFVKQGGECYFPAEQPLAKQYNNSLLQQLQSGNIPDDFTVLKEEYGKGENAAILAAIEAKTKEVVSGYSRDQDRALAVYRWIVENISYDYDLPRQGYELWIEGHPQDAVRYDNPLNAFSQRYAMCYGYAKLTTLMMGYAGVDCVYIAGRHAADVSRDLSALQDFDEHNHAWNAVKLSGNWYFIDTCEDALYAYYRTNREVPGSGYTQVNRGPAYIHTFPSLNQISRTHAALRLGAKGYGKKLEPTSIQDGLQEDSLGVKRFYNDGVPARDSWMRIDGKVYYFGSDGTAVWGWQLVDGYWRCFDSAGVLLTGRQAIQQGAQTRTYHFDNEGCVTGNNELLSFLGAVFFYQGKERLTGWRTVDGHLRYFQADGRMYTGSDPILNDYDGTWYTFTNEGIAVPRPPS